MMRGTIHNRDAFLSKISGQLGRTVRATGIERPTWKYQPQDEVLKGADVDALLNVLIAQCANIHTKITVTTKAGLVETVNNVVTEYGGGPIVTWKDDRFYKYGLQALFNETWPANNMEVREWDYLKKEENIVYAEKANIGITISDITLAESGTAVLFSSKDKGRSVSFLPIQSVILIPKSTIVPRMTQAARIIREKTKNGEHLASCINFITGPSNSADIELNLVVGVHGPVKVTYVVIDDL